MSEDDTESYKIAKQKARAKKGVGEITVIRNQGGDIVTSKGNIKERWEEYFNELLCEENEQDR